jgi:hypothetical protein
MHRTRTVALVAAMLLVACGDKDDSGTADSGTTAGVVPLEGDWLPSNAALVNDGCNLYPSGLETNEGEATPGTLTLIDDSTFTITDDDGLELSCALETSGSFSCDPSEDTQDFLEKGADILLTRATTYSGVFGSPTSGNLSMTQDFSCDGADCDLFEKKEDTAFPCSVLIESDINLVE